MPARYRAGELKPVRSSNPIPDRERLIVALDVSTQAEALALVAQLFACAQPHTSPAGRPTHFELSKGDLAKRFQR